MLSSGGLTQNTNRISGERRWFALGAVLVTMFFSALDQTVVSTAMPVIIGDLKGFSIYAWVFTAYMIASTVMVPIYGKLSDVYGRKPFYILGLGLFMIGSALSGQAHTMGQLIIFRAFQGIGGGAMLSMPRATIGDIFNPRERGRWMGIIAMTFGLASIVGPFLGGWITDHWGWRWIFYINLPVAAASLAAILYALPRVRVVKQVHIDWAGSVLLVVGLVPMLLGFTWAGSRYAWGSPQIIGLFVFSVGMLVLFGWTEQRVPEPVIPIEFFRVRLFTTANLIGFLLTIGMFGTLMFLPIYVQGVLGMTAQNSGAVMTPMMLSVVVGALVAGQMMTRTGRYKLLTILSAAVMAVGMFLMTRLGAESTWGIVVRDMLVTGVGIGGLMPTLNVAVQNAFPYKVMGVVNASQQFVRSLGGAIAAPILGTVLANTFAARLEPNLPAALKQAVSGLSAAQQKLFLNPQSLINSQAQIAIRSQFSAFGAQAETLYKGFIGAVHQALASGMTELFLIALGVSLAAFVVTFFLPEISLKHDEFFETAQAGADGSPSPADMAACAEGKAPNAGDTEERVPGRSEAAGGGGKGDGHGGGQPSRAPSNRRPWILAGITFVIVLILLGLGVHGLIVRNRMARELESLKVQTQTLAHKQDKKLAVLQSGLEQIEAARKVHAVTAAPTGKTPSVAAAPAVTLLTSSVTGAGTIVPDHGSYRAGTTVSLRAVPNTGWHFVDWSGDASGKVNLASVTMDRDRQVAATFAPDIYRITTSVVSDGSISPSGAVSVNYGASRTFVITPAEHYHVVDVLVDGTSVGAVTRYTFTDLHGDHTITARFAKDEASLAISVVGRGTVSPARTTYSYRSVVTLQATPDPGWHFVGWSGDASGSVRLLELTLTGDKAVTATFAIDTETITASAAAHGAISPSGSVAVAAGSDQTFSITPDAGYRVADVLVDDRSVGAVTTFTFRDVMADHTITAHFIQDDAK